MVIRNKEVYKLYKKDLKGNLEINNNYESEFLQVLNKVFCKNEIEIILDNDNYIMFNYKGIIWTICDNGGEMNISVVNGDIIPIPYTKEYFGITPATLAYRVYQILKEVRKDIYNINIYNVIDWSLKIDGQQEALIYKQFNIA